MSVPEPPGFMTPEDEAKLANYALTAEDLPRRLADQHGAASTWLTTRAGTAEAVGRVLLDPRVLGEHPARFGWMDVVMSAVALAMLTLGVLGFLGMRAVVAPPEAEQVVLTADVPAYHRLLRSELAVQNKPQVDGSFLTLESTVGLLTTHALKKGAVIRKTQVTNFTVSPDATIITVSVESVPTGLQVSQTVNVVSPKGEAAGKVLALRPGKEGVSLQLIVDAKEARRVAGQKVFLITPTQ
ncbi:hypothetical protein IHN63_04355 [Deinococcus sp. 6YEL10]|uniref:hypothetical protein n=1 Tax=Deinococcus sp. 6YEL10 TaxID=2745870 RepID=UPI001E3EC321|nr:hypothetical protein [Deinococcus sp. 6YEL10]MCD0160534.1 hypothetical protein [Deinococcus sp. 6YEL10]